jgi:hypothetical protein
MKIYVRTEEGQEAAYSPQSALPRKLKSILKVVDGKTRTQVFKQNLHSFGDVEGLLQSLEMAGLLKTVPDGSQNIRFNLDMTEADRAVLTKPNHADEWFATRNPLELPSQFAPRAADGYSQFPSSMTSPVVDQQKSAALASTLDLMANFVLIHLPDQSFQVLKEIEEITSLEVLAATLGGYEQMVSHLGAAGADHLRQVKSVLRDNL